MMLAHSRTRPETRHAEMRLSPMAGIPIAGWAAFVFLAVAGAYSAVGAQVVEGEVEELDDAIFWFARTELGVAQSPSRWSAVGTAAVGSAPTGTGSGGGRSAKARMARPPKAS